MVILVVSFTYPSLQAGANPLNVVTTTGMIGDVVKNIGTDLVNVRSLMDTGVDPHLYRPTSGDIRALTGADVVFYNGLHLEGRMQDVLVKMARKRPIYPVAENITAKLIYADNQVIDPHVWMDVSLWRKVADYIHQTLIKHLPNERARLSKSFQNYDSKLKLLHEKIKISIASITKKNRILVTAHDAFAYFGRAYNIRVVGLQGINTADEFGLNDLIRVQGLIVKNNVKSVFLESSVTAKFIQSLQKGLINKNFKVKIGGELFSDAMGLSGTFEGTYIGMMSHNTKIVVEGLK